MADAPAARAPAPPPTPPPELMVQLRHLLVTGNIHNSFYKGVAGVEIVEKFLIAEKHRKDIKKPGKKTLSNFHSDEHERFLKETMLVNNMVHDGYHAAVLQCLKEAINRPAVCWQVVIMCLVAVIKGENRQMAVSTAAYAVAPALLKDSVMLFFFISMMKVAVPTCGKERAKGGEPSSDVDKARPGWGRGLKNVCRRWYTRKSPEEFMLELWHRPKKYGWCHKDIIRLIHLKKDQLTIGSRVILHWYYTDLDKVKCKFAAVQEAATYIGWLDKLYNKQREHTLPESRLAILLELENDNTYHLFREQDVMLKKKETLYLCEVIQSVNAAGLPRLAQDSEYVRTATLDKELKPVIDDFTVENYPVPPPDKIHEADAVVEQPAVPDVAVAVPDVAAAVPDAAADDLEVYPENYVEPEEYLNRLKMHDRSVQLVEVLKDRLLQPGDSVARSSPITRLVAALNNFKRRVKSFVEDQRPATDKDIVFYKTPLYLEPVLFALEAVVLQAAKIGTIARSHPPTNLLVVVEIGKNMTFYNDTEIGFNVHRQIRGDQAVLLSLLSLCYLEGPDGTNKRLGDNAEMFGPGPDEFVSFLTLDFNQEFGKITQQITKKCEEYISTPVATFSQLMTRCQVKKCEEFVFFVVNLDASMIKDAYEYVEGEESGTLKKIVLVGLTYGKLDPQIGDHFNPRLIVLNGFNFRTLDVIKAYLQDEM